MISSENIPQLAQNNINYIVGTRLGNIPSALLEIIDKTISREDSKCKRIKTDNGYLFCSYSPARYRKDRYELEKQIVCVWQNFPPELIWEINANCWLTMFLFREDVECSARTARWLQLKNPHPRSG